MTIKGYYHFKISSNCYFELETLECNEKDQCKSAFMTIGDYKCLLGVIRDMISIYKKVK